MRRRLLTTVIFVALATTYAGFIHAENNNYQSMPSGTYKLDKTHASLVWKVSHLGLSSYCLLYTSPSPRDA